MPGKSRHLSKTDLRRGLFTQPVEAPAPAPAPTALPDATSAAEQALLFDIAPIDAAPKTRFGKDVRVLR